MVVSKYFNQSNGFTSCSLQVARSEQIIAALCAAFAQSGTGCVIPHIGSCSALNRSNGYHSQSDCYPSATTIMQEHTKLLFSFRIVSKWFAYRTYECCQFCDLFVNPTCQLIKDGNLLFLPYSDTFVKAKIFLLAVVFRCHTTYYIASRRALLFYRSVEHKTFFWHVHYNSHGLYPAD